MVLDPQGHQDRWGHQVGLDQMGREGHLEHLEGMVAQVPQDRQALQDLMDLLVPVANQAGQVHGENLANPGQQVSQVQPVHKVSLE